MVKTNRYRTSGISRDVPQEGHILVGVQQQKWLINLQDSTKLADLLFDQCGDCNKMACLPQSAFAVHKLRKPQNEKDLAVARLSTDKQDAPRYTNGTLDLTPVKYSDKLMNSIWGLYNRYSPHNFKKNNGSSERYFCMHQPFAVACAASEPSNSEAKYGPNKK
ncbi:uncharacterized protein LOC134204749 [Armigeres subalbatus]|uniref:uncharacterized protein LOC134204749 n=1 Tax=Armigeres subalbatus TaxID=124917 RepID=UPI002ED670FC